MQLVALGILFCFVLPDHFIQACGWFVWVRKVLLFDWHVAGCVISLLDWHHLYYSLFDHLRLVLGDVLNNTIVDHCFLHRNLLDYLLLLVFDNDSLPRDPLNPLHSLVLNHFSLERNILDTAASLLSWYYSIYLGGLSLHFATRNRWRSSDTDIWHMARG